MATHQLGVELAPEDERAIRAFLDALTGDPPADYIARPELPPGGEEADAAARGDASR
jgi:cytochrome c peroxidase